MERKNLTQQDMLSILNESDDPDNADQDNEPSYFWDYYTIPEPSSSNIYSKHDQTRTEKEQENEINEDNENPNKIEEQVIAGESSDGTLEVQNIPIELNVTALTDIKWRQSEFAKTKIAYKSSKEKVTIEETPEQYFMKYFTEQLFETMAKYTNIYGFQNSESFELTDISEIKRFIGIHLFIGCAKLPQIKMYWSRLIGIELVKRTMTNDRFCELRSNFHVVNDLEIPRDNKDIFYKVRPILNTIRERCLQIPLEETLVIDEQLIPFNGNLSTKEYMKGKQTPWGFNLFLLCGKSGQPFDFMIYQGSQTEISDSHRKSFGFGASVVLHLIKRIEIPGHTIYFDNFFTSYNLLEVLQHKGINAAGTARINRFQKPIFMNDREFKKKARGFIEQCVSQDDSISVVKWLDHKPVYLASNFIGKGVVSPVKRWNSNTKCYVNIPQPEVVTLYNAGMRGVDRFDQMIQYYQTFIRSKKWQLRVMTHFVDFASSACWIEYKQQMHKQNIAPKDVMDLLEFRLTISNYLMNTQNIVRKRGRPPLNIRTMDPLLGTVKIEMHPMVDMRYDRADHFPGFDKKKKPATCKLEGCSLLSHVYCDKCEVNLCLLTDRNCFLKYHTKED